MTRDACRSALGCGLAAALMVVGAPAVAAPSAALELTFDDEDTSGGVFDVLTNSGSAQVDARVVALNGGMVRQVDGRSGSAADFPDYGGSSGSARAVIRVRNSGSSDAMSPGDAHFEFGADLKLDAKSQGSSSVDNGDNLLQRGLHGDPSQFKLQVDKRRPSCTVKGNRGRVVASSPVLVDAQHWYRVECTRDGGTVSISVTIFENDGSSSTVSRNASGATGTLSFPQSTPLSIGGKLSSSGRVSASTDQFNGLAENAYLRLEGSQAPVDPDESVGTTVTLSVPIRAGSDDAEQRGSSTKRSSSDLELVNDAGVDQTVGLRFTDVSVPRGATITHAYVQFQADESTSGVADLSITGQDSDDATTFTGADLNISSRATTTASVGWEPPEWPTSGARTVAQRTPDLSAVVAEITSRPGWSSGNALAVIVAGSGRRTAEAFEGGAGRAAVLHIEYTR